MSKSEYLGPKLIIALDNVDEQEVMEIMKKLKDFSWKVVFKVNDLLFELWAKWMNEFLWKTWVQAMLDPKWHDIKETLLNYLRKLSENSELCKQASFVTVHASNWKKALEELVNEKKRLGLTTKIFAVTALTSLTDSDTQAIYDDTAKHTVLKLSKDALDAWVDWIVCSPREAALLREVFSDYNFEIITPWVRFEWWDSHDQKRVTTPADAIKNWSNHIVMWRPVLKSKDMKKAVKRFFSEIKWIFSEVEWKYKFEKLLYTWEWLDLLKYIWAIYKKPEWWKYCRLASKLLSDTYINIWATERNYLVLERAWEELAKKIEDKWIKADVIMWAQMWSVRLSWVLWEKLWIEESIYTEKNNPEKDALNDIKLLLKTFNGKLNPTTIIQAVTELANRKYEDDMQLNRHDIDLTWKKIILSEDIVTKWSTLKKMIEIVRARWWEVVAITCVWNRYWKNEFDWIPLISCFVPPQFNMFYDQNTPKENRWNTTELPEWSNIAEKPKNIWPELVKSMR